MRYDSWYSRADFMAMWNSVVTEYILRGLSDPDDRLGALSGIHSAKGWPVLSLTLLVHQLLI